MKDFEGADRASGWVEEQREGRPPLRYKPRPGWTPQFAMGFADPVGWTNDETGEFEIAE